MLSALSHSSAECLVAMIFVKRVWFADSVRSWWMNRRAARPKPLPLVTLAV
jgi:hypothetical protein